MKILLSWSDDGDRIEFESPGLCITCGWGFKDFKEDCAGLHVSDFEPGEVNAVNVLLRTAEVVCGNKNNFLYLWKKRFSICPVYDMPTSLELHKKLCVTRKCACVQGIDNEQRKMKSSKRPWQPVFIDNKIWMEHYQLWDFLQSTIILKHYANHIFMTCICVTYSRSHGSREPSNTCLKGRW